jgi:Outer membrane protein and related peptidoglycan-associated (lipo)proteins
MHAFSRKALFILLSAAALVATGCSKKPKRPDPSATVIGQQGSLNPHDAGMWGPDGSVSDPNSLLTDRGSGDINDPANQERGVLESVYFAFDQSAIAANERPKLAAAKAYLDANPGKRLLIEGHCDWRGTAEYNLGLGDRRAQSAKQYLVTLGVPADRIEVLSKGDLEATENASAEVMAKDRRAELIPLRQ